MKLLEQVVKDLGHPYKIRNIDGEDVIFRTLGTKYEFEVSGISGKGCTLYVWAMNPHELVGIYAQIPICSLKDTLGYFAVIYQNLTDQILVLREDKKV